MKKSLPLALAALAIASAAPAHADDGDPVGFIRSLKIDGVPYQTAFDAIHFGYVVCHTIDQGYTPARLANEAIANGTTYTPYQLHLLIGDAVRFLCPQHANEIPVGWG
jgi:hypothetical protein